MPTRNLYFSHGTRSERFLYEDLMIEQLKVFGQEVTYLPRTIVARDTILGEDALSKFEESYSIEMYVENVSGFEGEGDIISKFGLDVRDDITLVVSKRRFDILVDQKSNTLAQDRPKEGDVIYMPVFKKMFEIQFVEDEDPYYQIADIPLFKLKCTTFSYSNERLDTGITDIDVIETNLSTDQLVHQITLETGVGTTGSLLMETPSLGQLQLDGTDSLSTDSGDALVLDSADGTSVDAGDDILLEDDLGDYKYLLLEDFAFDSKDSASQNKEFAQESGLDTEFEATDDIFDFTEKNPFGDPYK
tara:strand:+ start:815 stop:1723 length:909 start_codon:yes stop_codon:yes gene_type:complete